MNISSESAMDILIKEIGDELDDQIFSKKTSNKKFEFCKISRECEIFKIEELSKEYFHIVIPLLNSKYSYSLKMSDKEDIKNYLLKQVNNYVSKLHK